jgi:hypothetical protein
MSSIIDPLGLIILGLAVYRACRLVVEDQIFSRVRDAIWEKYPPTHGFGYLFTCYWCTSIWVASFFTLAYIIVPMPTMVFALALAVSAIAGFIAARVNK